MTIVIATLHTRPSPQAVPLAAACLAAALPSSLRDRIHLLDLFPEMGEEEMAVKILAPSPDLVAFPLYAWNRKAIVSLAKRLKEEHPRLYLVGGGPEASADPEKLLSQGSFDAVVRGEGEVPFRALMERLSRQEDPAGLPGVCVRTDAGSQCGPEIPQVESRAELVSPWLSGTLAPKRGEGVLWETSRGCVFNCDYCYDARGAKGLYHFPTERLAAELDLFAKAGVGQVWVLDSTFNYPPERGKELLRLIAAKTRRLHFHFEAKADFLDRETVHLLSRLRCSVQIGLQSARPEILRTIHRQFDPELFIRRLHMLQAEGVTFGLDLMYGLPGDDYAGFRHSLGFALDRSPNHVEIFPLAVLPGTTLHRRREELGLRALDHPPYHVLESPGCSAADLRRCRELAAAADLFYNVGRAVAFFPALLKATGLGAASFLEQFALWVLESEADTAKRFFSPEKWSTSEVLALQERYVTFLLQKNQRTDLLPAALDLMRFHFHYAETLLGEETLPARPGRLPKTDPWETPWRTGPAVHLVSFSYEVLELQEMEEADLETFTAMFRPVGSTAIFLRRGDQVFCESLEEDFRKLLQGSDGKHSPREIFGGSISREEGMEILEFALAEGFLVAARSA